MAQYSISNDGVNTVTVTSKEFYEILKEGNHCLYSAGGCNTLLPLTKENVAACQFAKNNAAAEATVYSRLNRCLDSKCRICRYVRDDNDNIVINAEGKKIGAKCSECPRAGWATGKRDNCCLHNECTFECSRCPFPKEGHAHLSADALEESGFGVPSQTNFTKIIEDKLLLETLLAALDGESEALINAVYFDERDLMDYARELHISEPDKKLKSIHRTLLRKHERILAHLKKLAD